MDINNVIAAAVKRYQPRREHFLVEEWDRESPINDTSAAEILAANPPGFERTVLLKVGPLDITIYRQNVNPETRAPLQSDRDVERVKGYMAAVLIPRLLADENLIKNAVAAALARRMYTGLEAELRAEEAALGDPPSATEDPF